MSAFCDSSETNKSVIEAYIYASCSSCRKTIAQMDKNGAHFQSRDYFRQRFDRNELQIVLAKAGLKPSDLLSTRSKAYAARGLGSENLTDNELLDLMLQEPTLLRRPLVFGNGLTVVGHNASKLTELIEADS